MSRTLEVLGVALAMTAASACSSAALAAGAAAGRDGGGSIVLCSLAHPPPPPGLAARAPLWRIGDGRLLAPARPAMFFSHRGDRCAWAGRRPLAG